MSQVLLKSWQSLDALLRGELKMSERQSMLRMLLLWQWLAAALFGLSLGVYALTSREELAPQFMLANAIKFPLLLALTTVVTCPSLYVFGALRGLRFTALEFVGLLVVAHTILAVVLGSLGPVLAFFALTTHSYSFIVLLAIACCTLGGVLGLRWFLRAIHGKDEATQSEETVFEVDKSTTESRTGSTESPAESGDQEGEVEAQVVPTRKEEADSRKCGDLIFVANAVAQRRQTWQVLGWWLVLYAFVGAQMSWVLRPFIGSPHLEFALYRRKSGSFFEALFQHLGNLLGG